MGVFPRAEPMHANKERQGDAPGLQGRPNTPAQPAAGTAAAFPLPESRQPVQLPGSYIQHGSSCGEGE